MIFYLYGAGAANSSSGALNNQRNQLTESIVLEAINIQHRSRGFPNIGQVGFFYTYFWAYFINDHKF